MGLDAIIIVAQIAFSGGTHPSRSATKQARHGDVCSTRDVLVKAVHDVWKRCEAGRFLRIVFVGVKDQRAVDALASCREREAFKQSALIGGVAQPFHQPRNFDDIDLGLEHQRCDVGRG